MYNPSGHLVQYRLLPSVGAETGETAPRTAPVPSTQIPEEDLRVRVKPIQWWDVCRRNDWPEKEEFISGKTLGGPEAEEMSLESSDSEYDCAVNNNSIKYYEQCHFSNAEVQINSGRIPIW